MIGTVFGLLAIVCGSFAVDINFPNHEKLDDNYELSWIANGSHIMFKTTLKVRDQKAGWMAIGISEDGKMFPADMAVAYLSKPGHVAFSDRHSTGFYEPIVDSSQDWIMEDSYLKDAAANVVMYRKLDTGDSNEDVVIKAGVTHLIWAYGEMKGDNKLSYHGTTRGSRDLVLVKA